MQFKTLSLLIFFSITFLFSASSGDENLGEFIIHHVSDGNSWHPIPGVHFDLPHDLTIVGIPMGITLHVLMVFFAGFIVLFVFLFLYKKKRLTAPSGFTNALEVIVLFVRNDICISFLGEKDGKRLAPIFLNIFFFILAINLLGLIPFFSTATANFNLTAGLAIVTLTMMILGGLIYNGPIGFLKLFLPPGVPKVLYLILFPIEFIGLIIKPFALLIRLYANMLAGHIVILSLLGLIFLFKWAGIPSLALVLFIYALELMVAFIQAYIFTMLSALFVGQMLHPEH